MATTCLNIQGVQRVRDHLSHVPRPDREAKRALGSWLRAQGVATDPDLIVVVTLHLRPHGPNRYRAQLMQRVSLPQAVLINWQGESNNDVLDALIAAPWAGTLPTDGTIELVASLERNPWYDNGPAYEVFNGLFRRTEPQRFDATTLVNVRAESLQRHIESLDFHTRCKRLLQGYWHTHLQTHRLCCKLNFIAACNEQVAQGSLSDAARLLVWQAAGLIARGPHMVASPLNIYGYAATDVLCLHDTHTDLMVLYVPGNSSPLLEFASQDLLRDWVGDQCKDLAKRQALKRHFRLADAPQGLDFSGLDTALEGIAAYPASHRLPPEHGFFNDDGTWPPRTYVNYRPERYSPPLQGDVFNALAERQRQRSLDDADFLITSDREIAERRWRGYLDTTLSLLLPLAFVVPGLAPVLAIGGIVQMGIGLDEAINGKTLEDKLDGVGDIAYGLFNAVPLAAEGANKVAQALYRTCREGFVMPTRLNDQIGYPLSPIDPPRLPPAEVAPYFHRPARIAPLADGNAAVALAIRRYPRYTGEVDLLRGTYEPVPGYGIGLELVYDMETDLFLPMDDLNAVEPRYYEPDPATGNLRRATAGARPVSHAMRVATLRALGVDLPLPVELPAFAAEGAQPIPKRVTALWVGDKQIADDVLDNLAHNARALADSPYQYRLMLSKRDPEAFAANQARLAARVPGLHVLPLEEQAFYEAFAQSPAYAQYQAAMADGGRGASSYASAADVLRYPMLYSEGGLYMDVDDTLLARPDASQAAPHEAALNTVELAATPDGLLLQPPLHSEVMGLDSMYNNSMIGSHPNNPTLLAISEEMQARYLRTADAYPPCPSRTLDPVGFRRFARHVSWLTGPALLTDVVDRLLPDLYRLRQLSQLYMLPRINSALFVDIDTLNALREARLPLMRVAKVGSLHSWAAD